MTQRGRYIRKLRKLRRDPVRYFDDARSPMVRNCGLWGMAILMCLTDMLSSPSGIAGSLFSRMAGQRARLVPQSDLVNGPDFWESVGEDPQFAIRLSPPLRLGGWRLVSYDAVAFDEELFPVIYFDEGNGMGEESTLQLPAVSSGSERQLVRLPDCVRSLRFDPLVGRGRFHIENFEFCPLTAFGALRYLREREGKSLTEALRIMRKLRAGVGGTVARQHFTEHQLYADWVAENDTLTDGDRAAIEAHIASFDRRPRFSVLMPVYNTPAKWLDEAIESIRAQLYPDWELCLVDDASSSDDVSGVLARHAAADARIKVHRREQNGGIVAASNDALTMATGDWVALVDHDDRLAEHALYLVAETLNRHADATMVYSDSDHLTPEGERWNPCFKPDWDYDLCLGQNLVNHLAAFRRDVVERAGGFREGFDGSQDWDLVLRVVELAPPETILHVPWVLYHWRISGAGFSQSRTDRTRDAGRRAVESHLARVGTAASVGVGATSVGHLRVHRRLPETPPLVSIVIPTRDCLDLLRRCVAGILRRTDYANLELLVVDNGSVEPATHAYYEMLRNDGRVRILDGSGEFNFSRLCNQGVAAANGEVYVLLNNDVDVINTDWLDEMVSHAVRPDVGAVGAKLYYPDDTIQHAGVILGIGGIAGHGHKRLPRASNGYFGRANLTQQLSAVTAACLAGRVDVYERLGGLDAENLKVAFNDVDFCLRAREAGYRIIWTPFAELYHYESASRGSDMSPGKAARFGHERKWMEEKWHGVLETDPAYNPNLTLEHENFGLAVRPRRVAPWEPFARLAEPAAEEGGVKRGRVAMGLGAPARPF